MIALHGGAARPGAAAVSATQPSVLRLVPLALRLAHAGRGDLAVLRLLNSARGWDSRRTPVDDVHWALGQVSDRYPGLPVALVGHSLGGRAALLAGGSPGVRSVVALNAWVQPGDHTDLSRRCVLFVHGDEDRVADPQRARGLARALARSTADVGFVTVRGGEHAMLRRGSVFTRAATDFVTATLLERQVNGPVGRVLAGQRDVIV